MMQNVENSYVQATQSPSEENANAFENAMNVVRTATKEYPLGSLSPSRRRLLESINGSMFYGENLISNVENIVTSSDTPSNAITAIQRFRTTMQEFLPTIHSLNESLDKLGIAIEDIPDDCAEIEILIPATFTDGHLDGLYKEIRYLNTAISDIREVVTSKRAHLDVRSISSGSFELFLVVDITTGAAVLNFVTAVVLLINSILQSRQHKEYLRQQEAPQNIIDDLEKWEKDRIDVKINELRSELINRYDGKEGRRNELDNALARSLNRLADKIDNGMDIDVTTAATPDTNPEGKSEEEQKQIESRRQDIESITSNMNTINLIERNKEPVLELPSSEEE